MAASLSGLSASVTRILYLTGFPKELKTKDIQSAFSEYENQSGGFKIKWRDDTSLLIVFQDATVAKRAYLNTIAFPPQILTSSTGASALIKPYDGPDAQTVIQTVNARGQHNPNNPSRSHHPRSTSFSVLPSARSTSGSSIHPSISQRSNGNGNHVTIPEKPEPREHSPTLPSLPSHPTLNSLISEAVSGSGLNIPSDPAILTSSLHQPQSAEATGGPRIGDPGRRMLGAALGVRHPGLGPRVLNGNGSGNGSPARGEAPDMRDIQRAMGGLVVAE
ncbi:hypothetical protein BJ165DRAFT_1521940 [Panaeolus papilionaceus]|nr:hypothetical protein BJ165DRAFT_1521940 [Panaeolus papilionaceus]